MTTTFAYDVVEYPSAALPQAHPGHLFAVARMFGLNPAPADTCRYLEVGCGDGTHLIACAADMPASAFVGIDLSAVAVERGRRLVAELGLSNVSLYAADLTTWEPPAGGFDYAVAHGLYSWVPTPVRDVLLELLARCLRPTGVGYVSYNAYPGCYVRRMVWEMLRYETAGVTEPGEKLRKARETMEFLTSGLPADGGPVAALYRHELNALLTAQDPSVLYHDDLGVVNDPVYFHEFASHAKRFGLRFVAEAEPNAMDPRAFPPAVAAALTDTAERDPLAKEQQLDFLRLRRFRQTLLSPDGGSPRAAPDPGAITRLAVSGNAAPQSDPADLAEGVAVTFAGGPESTARVELPIVKAALVELAGRWPGRVPFPELVLHAAARLGRGPHLEDGFLLTDWMTSLWMAGMVALHGHRPRYSGVVTAHPVASPLARAQAARGATVTTPFHASMQLSDAERALVRLLDGTRDREQLAAQGSPPEELERTLDRFAKAGLLVG